MIFRECNNYIFNYYFVATIMFNEANGRCDSYEMCLPLHVGQQN